MSTTFEEVYVTEEPQDIKYPIHIGPVFSCNMCKTNFITLVFLWKHQTKCMVKSVHFLNKTSFESIKKQGNKKAKHEKKIHNTMQLESSKKERVHLIPNLLQKPQADKKLQSEKKKNFQCNICEKKFSEKSVLIRHSQIHTGEKPYQCDICKKHFNRKYDANKHMRIHTGEKPYQCEMCEKQFTQSSNLKKHMRIHTGEKPYECEVCKKKFTDKSLLTRHFRIHTGEKPYQCYICTKQFNDPSSLSRHIKIHTDEKIYNYISQLHAD